MEKANPRWHQMANYSQAHHPYNAIGEEGRDAEQKTVYFSLPGRRIDRDRRQVDTQPKYPSAIMLDVKEVALHL